jgi:hypothetical protein
MVANRDFGLRPKYCFFEFKTDVFAEIGSTLCTRALARAAAKHIADPEYVSEDVAEILESSPAETYTSRAVAAEPSMTEAIIGRTLFTVAKDSVGFAGFFKLLLCIRIVRIAVGMVLQSELSIGALKFLIGRFSRDPENFVVVTFYVTGQRYLPKILRQIRFCKTYLVIGIAGNFNHCRTQEAVFQLIAALKFIEYGLIIRVRSVNHLYCFMQMRIERLTHGCDGTQTEFG